MRGRPDAARGNTLIEVLVALLVLSLSLIGAQHLQAALRVAGDSAYHRTVATQLAQSSIEATRLSGAVPAAEDIVAQSADFRIEQRLRNDGPLRDVMAQASWADRLGERQQVALDAGIAPVSPRHSAALVLPPRPHEIDHPPRPPHLPPGARDLGDGRSAWKPNERGTAVWVVDSTTGLLLSRCRVAAALSTSELTAAHLTNCEAIRGSVISGHVRFALGPAPDVDRADDPALPFVLSLELQRPFTVPAVCSSQALRTARVTAGGVVATRTVPVEATAASLGASQVEDLGERFVAYQCVIADARWSGRLSIAPSGWALGTGPGQHRVCRLGDTPEVYRDAQGALRQQNLLVIRGPLPCPGAPSGHNGDPPAPASP